MICAHEYRISINQLHHIVTDTKQREIEKIRKKNLLFYEMVVKSEGKFNLK